MNKNKFNLIKLNKSVESSLWKYNKKVLVVVVVVVVVVVSEVVLVVEVLVPGNFENDLLE